MSLPLHPIYLRLWTSTVHVSLCVPHFPHLFIVYFLQLPPFTLLSLNDFPIMVHDALYAWHPSHCHSGQFSLWPGLVLTQISPSTSAVSPLSAARKDLWHFLIETNLITHHKQENLHVNFLLRTLDKHSRSLLHAQPEFLRKPQFALQWSGVACWARHGLQVRPPGLNPSSSAYCVLKGKVTSIQF